MRQARPSRRKSVINPNNILFYPLIRVSAHTPPRLICFIPKKIITLQRFMSDYFSVSDMNFCVGRNPI